MEVLEQAELSLEINLEIFLFNCLFKANISNISTSTHIDDGLKLNKTYITNILKCVPPEDKPLKNELSNCSTFFKNELTLLKNLKVIIALGKVSFDNCINFIKKIIILIKN